MHTHVQRKKGTIETEKYKRKEGITEKGGLVRTLITDAETARWLIYEAEAKVEDNKK
ncbi:MAG: hypothetical protein HXS44_01865 [Theionarchaea archaeon]|nr:hypothetical protein [Theionarchaea archaeon]